MADIVLATLNARYIHSAFGLRYLKANLGPLGKRCAILEFTLKDRPADIAERILAERPRIVGLGVYVWNALESEALAAVLKRVAPEVTLVLGGPEVSYETEAQPIARIADVVICREGEVAFRELCEEVLLEGGAKTSPLALAAPASSGAGPRVIDGGAPPIVDIHAPYALYSDEDVAHRIVYVEASRGCPYKCEFCLSSLDQKVRAFALEPFLGQMQTLLDRGVKHFKFIDRTFNLKIDVATRILRFFRERYVPGMLLHFEMVPDRFPEALRPEVEAFPHGALQFEVGIQTFTPKVAEHIHRRQDIERTEDNLRFLAGCEAVHIHADLIVGLPGETLESLAASFDRLYALGPDEIQVGILKRLRGTPIARHDDAFAMVYADRAPYEVLSTSTMDFALLQRLKRFARYWDMVANSGRFSRSLPALLGLEERPFQSFLAFSDWLFEHTGQTHHFALDRLSRLLLGYLEQGGLAVVDAARLIAVDYSDGGKRHLPDFLEPHIDKDAWRAFRKREVTVESFLPRQARHQAARAS